MYWKITADYLYDGQYITTDRVGTHVGKKEDIVDELLKVRLLDDDGEHYYTAVADDEALENLFFWSQRDTGTTLLQVYERGKGWVDTIG